jgi:hypothetical protein
VSTEATVLPVSDRTLRISAGVGVAAMAGGAFAVWYFDPSKAGFFPTCPIYTLTGFACPGCGMTRGFHALFHGDVLTALDFNAMIPLAVIVFGYLFLSLISYAGRGKVLLQGSFNLGLLWAVFGLLILFGIVRNLPYYPFSVLFP